MTLSNPLSVICQSLYNRAMLTVGGAQNHDLAGGLRLTVIIRDNTINLMLSRKAIYPSSTELNTVIKYWPWRVKEVVQDQFEHKERYYIRAKFPCCQ